MRPARFWVAVPVAMLAGLYALVARDMLSDHTIRSHAPTRAENLATRNPLVVMATVDRGNRVRVVRAVFGSECEAVAFREVAHVWFYDSQVPCSQLP